MEFQAPAAQGDALLAAMRTAAPLLVRKASVELVAVCQRADSREHARWLERATAESAGAMAALLPGGAVESERGSLNDVV